MQHADAATTLEAILEAENAALERHDAEAAVAYLDRKRAATQALTAEDVGAEQLRRLRDLSTENCRLLERAIAVQSEIINMVARAAKAAPNSVRYGAAGRTVHNDGALAIARQA